MDSDDLYDEFGNFLGDANDSDADSSREEENGEIHSKNGETLPKNGLSTDVQMEEAADTFAQEASTALTVAPSLQQRFSGVETIVVDPTAEGLDEPVIKPIQEHSLRLEYKAADDDSLPETTYSKQYLKELPKQLPERIRNVAVVGHLHTGKTSLIDTLVTQTHPEISGTKKRDHVAKPVRYLDTHKLEQERGMTLFTGAVSLLLADSKGRSYVFNLLDCPGHPDFRDEVYALLDVVEGVVVVLDVLEGLTAPDKRIITEVMRRNLPMVVVLNKLDRLVLELRLPPHDTWLKLRHVLSDINAHIHHNEYATGYTQEKLVSPLKNNVIFASHTLHTSFTLATWGRLYAERGKLGGVDEKKFTQLLWGEVYYENGVFSRTSASSSSSTNNAATTFEHFVLQPLYKIVSHTLVADKTDKTDAALAQLLWSQFGVSVHKLYYECDPQTLLQEVFRTLLSRTGDLVHLVVTSVGPPDGDSVLRAKGHDTGHDMGHNMGHDMGHDQNNFVLAEVFKMSLCRDNERFECLAKIHKGTLRAGARVNVVGSSFPDDNTDFRTEHVTGVRVPVGRYSIPVTEAYEGTIVVVEGIGHAINKSATLISTTVPIAQVLAIHKRDFAKHAFFKVAVECEKPAELPQLVAGLSRLTKCYPSAMARVEESGEHVVLAPGELYMDCFLHDLRHARPVGTTASQPLLIKVSDPMVKFGETCGERSATKITATSTALGGLALGGSALGGSALGGSKKHAISIIAEPVADKHLLRAIEAGRISLRDPPKATAKLLREEFGWDALAARSVWTFGPNDMLNPSMLLDDTLEADTDKARLQQAKGHVTAGFGLAVNEGPLCDEPIRRTKFKILDAVLGPDVASSGGQVIPMARNAVHCGLLTAAPRLLEPMYRVHVTCTYKSVGAVHTMLEKRRGWAVAESEVPATQLYHIEGCVPIMDLAGLDTDMRVFTQGQAFCSLEFFRWDKVPGDPMDALCELPSMKPVPTASLARDFVLKTRKRKGLSGEPSLQKYIDPDLYLRLKESGIVP